MAEYSGFFNAKLTDGEYDRIYYAEDFARYFANFVGNGVFEDNLNELIVGPQNVPDMSVRVLSGQAFINGYRYENDDELSLAIDVADGILNRIDLVVLRYDVVGRVIRLAVKKGTSASNPIAPSLQRDSNIYELKLAEVYVNAGVTNISQTNITDTRSDKDVCGFVRTIVDKEFNTLMEDVVLLKDRTAELQKGLSIESQDHPGCYYRIINEITEWINPPMMVGVEYRTTERFGGQPVYTKRFYVAKMTKETAMTINVGTPGNKVISVEGYMYDTADLEMSLFPLVVTNVVNTSAALGSVNSSGRLTIYVDNDLTTFECYVTIKYVK